MISPPANPCQIFMLGQCACFQDNTISHIKQVDVSGLVTGYTEFFGCTGGMVWLLTVGAPPHPYLLPIVLADHFQVESRSVASYAGTCDSRNSTGHSSELCEHPPAAHAVENAG